MVNINKLPCNYDFTAIIGAGVGGSSAAYHLNKLLKGNVELVVFDENSVIGGRAATVKVFENEYETGASVIHSKNRLAVDLVKELSKISNMALSNQLKWLINYKKSLQNFERKRTDLVE